MELGDPDELRIIVGEQSFTLDELLPKAFAIKRSKGHTLLDSHNRKLVSAHGSEDTAAQRAINAASYSYAPYTNSPEGFVIESITGRHFAGRVAESAA